MRGCWWALVGLIALSFITNIYLLSRPEPEPTVVIERDTVWNDTTIYKPMPAETVDIGKTVYLRIPYPVPSGRDTIHDSIDVPIPIIQKRYDDSLYTAWVSGFDPNLDSIYLRLPTITETVTKTYYEEPLFTFGLQGGIGYGITTHKPDLYIGIGGTINLWRNKKQKRNQSKPTAKNRPY